MWAIRDSLLVDIVHEIQDKNYCALKIRNLRFQQKEKKKFIWRPKTDRNMEFFTKITNMIYKAAGDAANMENIEPELNNKVLNLHKNYLKLQQHFEKYKNSQQIVQTNLIFDTIYRTSEELEDFLNYSKHVLPQHLIRLRRAVKERRSEITQDLWSILKHMQRCLSKLREERRIELPFVKEIEQTSDKLVGPLIKVLHGEFIFEEKENLAELAFLKLELLFYGLQSFILTEFTLIKLRAQLAESYFQQGYVERSNEFIAENFDNFKMLLLKSKGGGQELSKQDYYNGLPYVRVLEFFKILLQKVFKMPNMQNQPELRQLLYRRLESLVEWERLIEAAEPPIMAERPLKSLKVEQNLQNAKSENSKTVSYAIQYKKEGKASKLSLWSRSATFDSALQLRTAPPGCTRLIYRKLQNKTPKLVGFIEDHLETQFQVQERELYDLAKNYDAKELVENFESLLKKSADLNTNFENGRTLMHAIAQYANLELLKLIEQSGRTFDINATDRNGYTALHLATAQGHTKIVKYFLKLKADINIQTKTLGATVLHLAACKGKRSIVKALISLAACDINKKDKAGFTALHYATYAEKFKIVQLLSQQPKIELNTQSNAGLTALHIATLKNSIKISKFLLKQANLNVNSQTKVGFTPLLLSLMASNIKIFKLLLKHPEINVNLATLNGFTALHYCIVLYENHFFIELLKNLSLNVSKCATGNITPLMLSIMLDSSNFVLALLKAGCELNTQTQTEGLCALHVAVKFGRSALLLLVIAYGPDLELKTTNRRDTPLALATPPLEKDVLFDRDCERYLIQNGADFYYFCRR